MKDIFDRIGKLFVGCTLASLGITCVLKAGLGCFATTATNMTFHNMFGLSIGCAGFLVELLMMLILLYMKEGIGITAIVNMTYGSFMIDMFNIVLPSHPLMVLGLVFAPIGWSLMGMAGLGDTNSNLLTTALMKKTGKSIALVRTIQECVFLFIGLFRGMVTWFTFALSFGLGHVMNFIYKLMKYDPTAIQHSYLIGGGNFEIKKVCKK